MRGVSYKHCLLTFFIFFQNQLFENSFMNTIIVTNSLDPDQAGNLLGLIWFQTVSKSYQLKTLVGKELIEHETHEFCSMATFE